MQHEVSQDALKQIGNMFTYHPPHGDQPERYEKLRLLGKQLAYSICRNAPATIERDEAIKKLSEAIMWANAAIARGEAPDYSEQVELKEVETDESQCD